MAIEGPLFQEVPMSLLFTILNVAALAGCMVLLAIMQVKKVGFAKRVLTSLGLGIALGIVIKVAFGKNQDVLSGALPWYGLIGDGYVDLLRMIIIPLVMVSIISAILKLKDAKNLGKMSVSVILTLVLTAGIAAMVGEISALAFGLDARQISQGKAETERALSLERTSSQAKIPLATKILEIIPSNPFKDMTGARSTSTLAVVIFSAFLGVAAFGIRRKYPAESELVQKIVDAAYAVTMRLVGIIIKLTPFGVLAIMASTLASTDYGAIVNLLKFILASYTALVVMFIIHLFILSVFNYNPWVYVKKAWPVLTFAFMSRTSMGTIPLTIGAQTKKLGISDAIANFSATFGTAIGQNGCAGIYPAMLAVMIAPTVGIDPFNLGFLLTVALVTAISSFGVAGVGGGATFAALIVLSSLNLPIALAGLLISIEPLIDMGRTALNVSDAFVAGAVTGRLMNEVDMKVYNDPAADMDQAQAV
jgi:L-cystine uptake protein TcyP (sodium:dicarboxylate symporter family)